VRLDDRVEETADDRRCGISKLRTDVPPLIGAVALPPALPVAACAGEPRHASGGNPSTSR